MMPGTDLHGRRGLIVGIANDKSIAYGCAKAMHAAGAELAITYLNEKAGPYVIPLAEGLESPIILPCDLRAPGQLEAVFDSIRQQWDRLDFLVHSVAFAPKEALQARVVDCPRDGFLLTMDISCYSLVHMAKLAEPLMTAGGTLLTMTFQGSQRVEPDYAIMGPAKAMLEALVRYLASELGPKRIRVNAISPAPLATRAASGIANFDVMLQRAVDRLPGREPVSIYDVGEMAAFLVSDAARKISGSIHYIDWGYHTLA